MQHVCDDILVLALRISTLEGEESSYSRGEAVLVDGDSVGEQVGEDPTVEKSVAHRAETVRADTV